MLSGRAQYICSQLMRPTSVIMAPRTSPHVSPFREQWHTFATLPKLPVPPLRQTLHKFLDLSKPILSEAEIVETQKLVSEFCGPNGDGDKLQGLLEKRAKERENWLSDWWLEQAYLDLRTPLPIVTSPGLSFPLQNFKSIREQIAYSSKLVTALLKYKRLIDSKELPADMAGGQPMDMSQYDLLFGTVRTPGIKRDKMRYGCGEIIPAKHIVVARRGNYFTVPVISDNGEPLNCEQIEAALKQVVDLSPDENEHSVGLMTAQHRTNWGRLYKKFRANKQNSDCLEAIESSMFLLCLDEPVLGDVNSDNWETLMTVNCHQCLHGGGSQFNSNNRWFDKTLQFVVGEDGACGMTYEHSPAEGPPVAAMMEYAIDHIDDPKCPTASGAFSAPNKLTFDLDAQDKDEIKQAAVEFNVALGDVDLQVLQFDDFGKNFPKSQKLSPDSFLQVAYQLAYYRLHLAHPPTYETGTLRKFKLGRTETIRFPSNESAEFVEKFVKGGLEAGRLAELCKRAIASHREYTAMAMSGNGIDRHLMGLKMQAVESGFDVPKFHMGTAYQTLQHFKLSTSQVPTKHDCCMAFAPMYSDCYGICYNPQNEKINLAVSAFHSFPDTSAKRFAESIAQSLRDMRDIFIGGHKSKM